MNRAIFALIILAILAVVIMVVTSSCTYNVSMAHTSGTATDVIDDTQSPTNDISPNIEIPLIK